ncbi:MAG: methylenetetrahydrofolate--tRNA-(uracil(54)-C(5))-methyltransferase (FADH(2)-oxidizing) TrmFO [Bacillota bacterium]|nr:methylenetetrahydrofolate--tRNA-(uracil(54)-C(5))-methyltransferase (FADH(2)-oxidizing) TrmFO [Bacillota bacterium]
MSKVTILGAGLAGCEACWQVCVAGVRVDLYEMRPGVMTPAHHSGDFAELVCSNSLGSSSVKNASGLLKEELRVLGSVVLASADRSHLPAGGALAVDRWAFAREITEKISSQSLVTVVREEAPRIPCATGGPVIVATGPLTSPPLAKDIASFTGEQALYFFDAASPIVSRDSIDEEHAFFGSRYGHSGDVTGPEGGDYINCPLDEDQYSVFRESLLAAEKAVPHAFEPTGFFEGCLPVEEIARRGTDTLRYGPMKPVGLTDPRTGKRPYAVVQLRQDDSDGRMYNIVGFQTSLKWGEQDRVFRLVPALRNAEFLRYGVMHRNTYLDAPRVLHPSMQSKKRPDVLFAGQLCGVEGYVESTATGWLAGHNAARIALGKEPLVMPAETMMGALVRYIATPRTGPLQPMNSNWGLLPPVEARVRGKRRTHEIMAVRALEAVQRIL